MILTLRVPLLDESPAALSHAELLEHALSLRTILLIADAVHRARDLADLAERTVDAIVTYTQYPAVGLCRVTEDGAFLELLAARGFGPEVIENARRLPVQGSLTGVAVARGEVLLSRDLLHDARVDPRTRAALAEDGFREVLIVPLLLQDRAIGALNLVYRGPPLLNAHERRTLLAIGQSVALAMGHRLASENERRLEAQVQRANQLESLGLLAGGIAHDFNNLLTGVLANISLVEADLATDTPNLSYVRECITDAEAAALRGRDLARQLLTFASGGAPRFELTRDVTALVREAASFVIHGSSVKLLFDLAADLGSVRLDPSQFAQVVQNLVLNAVQASSPGGSVRISLERRELEAPEAPLSAGSYLCLTVTDHGQGIAPEALPKIFQPYYSMRHGGHGLGLATVYSIVKRHGGRVQVRSELGQGSQFTVLLPAPIVGDETPSEKARGRPVLHGGRALIMDDDRNVRRTARLALRLLGYEVEEAEDGQQAIEQYRASLEQGAAFRVVILDLTVPGGLGGLPTLAELRRLDPQVRAIVSSGYSSESILSDYPSFGFSGVLPKPYTVDELKAALEEALSVSGDTELRAMTTGQAPD